MAFALAFLNSSSAQILRISTVQFDAERRLQLSFASDANSYFLLKRGAVVTNINESVDIALGQNGDQILRDPQMSVGQTTAFFRVHQVNRLAPLDTDLDGIDDVWELEFRLPRAALDGTDAALDHNANGIADNVEFLNATPATVSFATDSSRIARSVGSASVSAFFNKPFNGAVSFQLAGNAAQELDYQPGFVVSTDAPLTGEILAAGASVSVPITLITNISAVGPSKTLIFTLLQPSSETYRLGRITTHVMQIVDGDMGVFAGALQFTNGAGLPPQAIKIALQNRSALSGTAFFDTSDATFFGRQPFTLNVQLSPDRQRIVSWEPASGTVPSPGGSEPVQWRLEIGPSQTVGSGFSAPVTMRLDGLSVSSRQIVMTGSLDVNPIDAPAP